MLHFNFVLTSSFSLFTIFQLSSTACAFIVVSTVSGSLSINVLFLLFYHLNLYFIHGTEFIHLLTVRGEIYL